MASILVVEDSRFLRSATERALTRAGYIVITLSDGEAALVTAIEKVPDLILLDMLMPKVGGQHVLQALKTHPATSHIPVIVLSSLSQANEVRLIKDGAAAYFEKSQMLLENNSDLLVKTIAKILGR